MKDAPLNLEEFEPKTGFNLFRNISYGVLTIYKNEQVHVTFEPIFRLFNISRKRRIIVGDGLGYYDFEDVLGLDDFIKRTMSLTPTDEHKRFYDMFYNYTPEQAEKAHKRNIEMREALKHPTKSR